MKIKFTRDSAVWWFGIIGAVLVFVTDQTGLFQEAFPNLNPIWISRAKFIAAMLGMLSAYLRMSPRPLSQESTLNDQPANPDKSLTMTGKDPEVK